MKCTCGVEISEHLAGECLDALVGEKVMGWDVEETGWYIHNGWKPSTDIACVMEVWDNIIEDDWAMLMEQDAGKVLVTITDGEEYYEGHADTKSLAICRAALAMDAHD